MKIGVFIGGATYLGVDDLAVQADKLGFQSFWVGDHMFISDPFYEAVGYNPEKGKSPYLEAWTTLAAISKITENIRIGTCVTPLPMRNPSILAKQVANVDFLSGGRVTLGVGTGRYEREFEAYGVSFDSYEVRLEKTIEGIEMMKKLWTEPFPTYEGKHYEIKSAPLWPKPIQDPHPPIWFGGESKKIMEALAKYGDGWVPYCPSPKVFAEIYEDVKSSIMKMERKVGDVESAAVVLAYIGSSMEEAREVAEPIVNVRGSRSLEAESWDEAKKNIVYGSPEDCIEKIEEYRKAGVQHLLLEMISPQVAQECVKKFGRKVLPYFKEGEK